MPSRDAFEAWLDRGTAMGAAGGGIRSFAIRSFAFSAWASAPSSDRLVCPVMNACLKASLGVIRQEGSHCSSPSKKSKNCSRWPTCASRSASLRPALNGALSMMSRSSVCLKYFLPRTAELANERNERNEGSASCE